MNNEAPPQLALRERLRMVLHCLRRNPLQNQRLAFLLFGACLPFWFSAMTMRAVGDAAMQMIREVEQLFIEHPDLLAPVHALYPIPYTLYPIPYTPYLIPYTYACACICCSLTLYLPLPTSSVFHHAA